MASNSKSQSRNKLPPKRNHTFNRALAYSLGRLLPQSVNLSLAPGADRAVRLTVHTIANGQRSHTDK